MKKIKKTLIFLLPLLSFILSVCVYASCVTRDVSGCVIRFHVKANSDAPYDQSVKLAVRDEVLRFISPALKNSKSISESYIILEENLSEIEKVSNNLLKKYNTGYRAKASLLKKSFPTKTYGNITLPAGKYDSLCIDLGDANGENWWCVMFPPLCFNNSTISIDEDAKNYLENNLNADTFAIINTNEENFTTVYRFKIFDYISSILN